MRVLIVGLGLIGGSLALALRQHPARFEILGVDSASVLSALPPGLCDQHWSIPAFTPQLAHDAELVVLALPIAAIVAQLPALLDVAAVVTDVGSTKRAIAESVARHPRRERYVPGHPMAGATRGGFESARADLFRGRPWVYCPEGAAEPALVAVRRLIAAVHALPMPLDVARHDHAVAVTSHVPQLLASALARLARERGAEAVAGPAFERMTEGAGGPEGLWRDVFATNADAVAPALRALGVQLGALADGLEAEPPDLEPLLALLSAARSPKGG